jgi:type IV secretory pathway VirJ component
MRILPALLLGLAFTDCPADTGTLQTLQTPDFGQVELVYHAAQPKGLVILFADEPPQRRDSLAGALADLDYVVAQIQPGHGFPTSSSRGWQGCVDLAATVQSLARQVVSTVGSVAADPPIVVGAGDGAALAYLAAAQARPHQLHATVSIDFDAVLPAEITPCRGNGWPDHAENSTPGTLEPLRHLNVPWFVFQPRSALTQGISPAGKFISLVPDARLTVIEGSSAPPYHGASLPEFMALMQWLDPRIARQVTGTASLTGLPLTEVPAQKPGDDRLVVMLSGDGGWAALDRGVSEKFAAQGIGTVGLDSLSYFWKQRTPAETAAAVAGIVEWYTEHWNKPRVILFGYSFGANVLPFVVNRLPPPILNRIDRVVLAGPGPRATFEFHLTNWLSDTPEDGLPVVDEIRRMPPVRAICIYGSDEGSASACPDLKNTTVMLHELPGDHHFNEDYARVAEAALDGMAKRPGSLSE